MSRRSSAKRFFGVTGGDPAGEVPVIDVLTSLNELALVVRGGFDQRAAEQIAHTAMTVFEARAVAVTNETEVLACVGEETYGWDPAVREQTAAVVDRRRVKGPTVYQLSTCLLYTSPSPRDRG